MEWSLGASPAAAGPGSIAWSESGVIACAVSKSIHLVTPGLSDAACRVSISVDGVTRSPAGAWELPQAGASEAHDLRAGNSDSLPLAFMQVAWSPIGAAALGGEYLAAVSRGHAVTVYGAGAHPSTDAWHPGASLSECLRQEAGRVAANSGLKGRELALFATDVFETTTLTWAPASVHPALLCCASKAGTVSCWDVGGLAQGPVLKYSVPPLGIKPDWVTALSWDASGVLAVGRASGTITFHRVSGNEVALVEYWPSRFLETGAIFSILWHSDARLAAAVVASGVHFVGASSVKFCAFPTLMVMPPASCSLMPGTFTCVIVGQDGAVVCVSETEATLLAPVFPDKAGTIRPRVWASSPSAMGLHLAVVSSQYLAKGYEIDDAKLSIVPVPPQLRRPYELNPSEALPHAALWDISSAALSAWPSASALDNLAATTSPSIFGLLRLLSDAVPDAADVHVDIAPIQARLKELRASRYASWADRLSRLSQERGSFSSICASLLRGGSSTGDVCPVCSSEFPSVDRRGLSSIACSAGHEIGLCNLSLTALIGRTMLECARCGMTQNDGVNFPDEEWVSELLGGPRSPCVECGGPRYRPSDRVLAYA